MNDQASIIDGERSGKSKLTVLLEQDQKRRLRKIGIELDANLSRVTRICLERGMQTFETGKTEKPKA